MFGKSDFFEEQVRRFSVPGSNSHVHVLLHSTNGDGSADNNAVECPEPFDLTERMWICRLPDMLRDIVYKACESPGEPYQEAFRQYGQLYTIALFMGAAAPGTIANWDGYKHITRFVTFAQLVRPTCMGFGNTAVLTFSPNGEFEQAVPGPCRGITEQAFIVSGARNWLSHPECKIVRDLLTNADIHSLPDRVVRANWNLQHSAYQYFFEVRTLLVVSAAESLIHVRTNERAKNSPGTGKQFKDRIVQLATQVGISFGKQDAEAVWDHRSDIAHGRDPWASRRDGKGTAQQPPELTKNEPVVNRYLTLEQILRAAVLKCLMEPAFSAQFESDDSVAKNYPVQ
jgi:hypothetical protein